MIDAQRFLASTQNVLVDLLKPQKEDEQKEDERDISDKVIQQGPGDYRKHMIVFALALFFFVIIKNA